MKLRIAPPVLFLGGVPRSRRPSITLQSNADQVVTIKNLPPGKWLTGDFERETAWLLRDCCYL